MVLPGTSNLQFLHANPDRIGLRVAFISDWQWVRQVVIDTSRKRGGGLRRVVSFGAYVVSRKARPPSTLSSCVDCFNKLNVIPALSPLIPACLKPFFLIMKLEPMNTEELTANAKPLAWSEDHRPSCCVSRLTPAASFVLIRSASALPSLYNRPTNYSSITAPAADEPSTRRRKDEDADTRACLQGLDLKISVDHSAHHDLFEQSAR